MGYLEKERDPLIKALIREYQVTEKGLNCLVVDDIIDLHVQDGTYFDRQKMIVHRYKDPLKFIQKRLKSKKYYFTFGSGQKFANCFIVIRASNKFSARKKMYHCFGKKWAGQYDENSWFDYHGVSQQDQFGLKELHSRPYEKIRFMGMEYDLLGLELKEHFNSHNVKYFNALASMRVGDIFKIFKLIKKNELNPKFKKPFKRSLSKQVSSSK